MAPVPKRLYTRMAWHMMWPVTRLRPALAADVRALIEARIAAGAERHTGQLRVVFESALAAEHLRARQTARQRALKVFSDLAVWDTEDNNGVLLYVLLADHAVEIVADRAAARRIPAQVWKRLCTELATEFARGAYLDGTLRAIDQINALLAESFPSRPA
ncbi:MAG: TPM domain-containing protein [Burkholderiaceae bacterium]